MRSSARCAAMTLAVIIGSSVVAAREPKAADASPRQLEVTAWTAVACSSGCSRAGYYDDPISGRRFGRIQVSQGVGDWIINGFAGGSNADTQFNAISCPAPAGCLAVGTTTAAGVSTPIASAGPSLKTKGISSGANGVSCPSTTFCMTVGWFRGANGVVKTLTEVSDAVGTWTIVPSPNVSGSTMVLNAVSCQSNTVCVAAGYLTSAAVEQPYTLQWNGASWSPMAMPVVNAAHAIRLNGVSCTSPTFCLAVGSEQGSTRGTIAFRWNGTAWTQVHGPTDLDAAAPDFEVPDFEFNAVSCGSPDVCTAVGSERGIADAGLIAVWDGVAWSHNPFPGPRPADSFYAVRCSTGGCKVAGAQTVSDSVPPIGVWYSIGAAGGASEPTMINNTRGDGWMNIEWAAPQVSGSDPIIGYRITTFTATGAAGPTYDVGPDARSVTVPETAAIHPGFLYALTATGSIGPSIDPTLFFGSAVTGPVNISTDWEASELPRLQQSADYLSMSTSQFQHDAVGMLAFILSLSPPSSSTPISLLVVDAGPSTISSTWPVADQPLLVSVTNQYGLTPSQTQKFAAQLIGYLLSLGGN